MKIDTYTYGVGNNSVLVVNRAIVNGIRDAGYLRTDHTPPLQKHGIDWKGVGEMADKVEPGADVAVCQASVSLEVLKRIREVSPDTKIVLQRDSSHCVWWKKLVEAEQEKFGIFWDVYGGGLLEREKAEYEIADRITVLSKWVQHTFEAEDLNAKVLHVGPQTFDRERWPLRPMQRKWDSKSEKFRVVFAGQTGLRKGLFYLLEAWKNLALPNAELLIAGLPENPMKELGDEIDKRILETPNVIKLNYVPLESMSEIYAKCHCLCIPSIEEGSTMTGLEAMSVGRPVIATFSAGIDVLRHLENGIEIDSGSWESIADALAFYHVNYNVWLEHAIEASRSVDACTIEAFGKRYVQRLEQAFL